MSPLSIPLLGLLAAVFTLIFLVMRTRVHVLLALLAAACIAGLTGGLSLDDTMKAITAGFGSTLGSIGIVIGLGVMMGRILEVSGAAAQIAHSFIRWLGKEREEWALALTGYLVSIPIFVDSAFVILFPVARALARKGRRHLLTLSIALAGGLVVTHSTIPPTPGPLGVAGLFGVDIGAMLLLGMVLAVPCVLGMVLYAQWLGKRYPHLAGKEHWQQEPKTAAAQPADKPLPGLLRSLLPILVPILLIFIKAMLQVFLPAAELTSEPARVLFQAFSFAGNPIIALSISTLLAVYTLTPHLDRQTTSARLEEGLQSAGIILMVTGAGGALGAVVRDSGTGAVLAGQIAQLPISPVMLPFIAATLVRLIQGSGTVAMITAASVSAPILAQLPGVNMLFAAQAATMGSLCFSYFNDSLFWVVNRMTGVVEAKQQMAVWSVTTTIAWAIGGSSVALLNLLSGTGGTLFDPLLPLLVLAIILLVLRRKSASFPPAAAPKA